MRNRYLAAGKDHLANHDYRRAILDFQNAAKTAPQDPDSAYSLALATDASGDTASASELYLRVLRLDPSHTQARLKAAQIFILSRDASSVEQGKELAEAVLSADPGNLKAINLLAVAEIRSGDSGKAVVRLRDIVGRFPAHVESAVNLARALMAQGDHASAEQTLRTAISKSPESATALFAMADFCNTKEDNAASIDFYKRGLQLEPQNSAAGAILGRLQAQSGQTADAERTFAQLAGGTDRQYRLLYGVYLFESGRGDAAIREFLRIFSQDGDDHQVRAYLTSAYLAGGRFEEADKLAAAALKKDPKDADALVQRARVYLARGDVSRAEADLQLAVQYGPNEAEAHFLLAAVHELRGDMTMQQQELTTTLRLRPDNSPARVQLAHVLLGRNDAQSALNLLDAAPDEQRKQPAILIQRNWTLLALHRDREARAGIDQLLTTLNYVDVLLQDATLRLRNNDLKAAQASTERALMQSPADIRGLELAMRIAAAENRPLSGLDLVRQHAAKNPNAAAVQMYLGGLEQQASNSDRARAAFRAAKAADSKLVTADLGLAEADLAEGRLAEARRGLSGLIDTHAAPQARVLLGVIESRAGNHSAATEHYTKALQLRSDDIAVMNNLAYTLSEHLGRPDDALKWATRAKQLAPDNAAVDDTLGWTYYRKGLYRQAVQYLENAVERGPTAVRQVHLAAAYAKLGSLGRAQAALEQALKMDPSVRDADLARTAIAEKR